MSQPLIDWGWVGSHLRDQILPALGQHIVVSAVSVSIGVLIAVPLGVLIARVRGTYTPVLFLTGLLYTIPSLALFGILIVLPGIGIGRKPAIIALVAYSLLVLVRNTVVGIDAVPGDIKEAARGMGLTSRQILWRVELPLALPVIVAGIRIATVSTIGIATIAAYIGAGGLGDLIFRGIDTDFTTKILVGAGLATLLALFADLALLAAERQLRPWSRRRAE